MAIARDITLTGNPETDQFFIPRYPGIDDPTRLLPIEGNTYTYSFRSMDFPEANIFTVTSEVAKEVTRSALKNISSVINIQFKEVDYSAAKTGGFDISSTQFVSNGFSGGGATITENHTEIYIDSLNDYNVYPGAYNEQINTVTHEVLHLLGFTDGVASNLNYTQIDTIMSYNKAYDDRYGEKVRVYEYDEKGRMTGNVLHFAKPESPGIYDILALQSLYGANNDYNADNTTYKFTPETLKDFQTIWDGGGIDTIDVSEFVLGVDLNLVGGTRSNLFIKDHSYSGIEYDGTRAVGIAYGANIENAMGGMGDDVIRGNALNNILYGGDGNDSLYGGEGNDTLYGGAGDDYLSGGVGNDLLYGGVGNNILQGGDGNDKYYVDIQSKYTIIEKESGGNADWFCPVGLVTSDITLYFPDNIEFGSSAGVYSQNGSRATIVGNDADNSLSGKIYADDILSGGKGNDILQGYSGSDTYLFNRGDGQDTIIEYDNTGRGRGDIDRLLFDNTISHEQLWFTRETDFFNDNLVISLLGTTDKVIIQDWFDNGKFAQHAKLEQITTADGITLAINQVESLVNIMSSHTPTAGNSTSIIDDYLSINNNYSLIL